MIGQVLAAVPMGIAFGLAIQSSGVASPDAIRAQFIFEKEIMMKMFLGGVAGSAFAMAILAYLNPKEFDKARESKGWGDKGASSAIIGGLLQGIGMALAGSCPGMAYAQLGMGTPNAPFLYLGGLVGALLYGLMHPWLKDHHAFDFAQTLEKRFESMHLERNYFNGHFKSTATALGVLMLAAAIGVDAIFPWQADVADVRAVRPEWRLNPIVAGLIVGSLQIPVFVFLGSLLGASSGYSVLTSQVFRIAPEGVLQKHTYARNFVSSKASWQVGLGLGIVLGSAVASGYADSILASLKYHTGAPQSLSASVNSLEAFIGGFLIVYGARFVGGCASGHGLTGLPSLHVVSWFVVPAMFAGGIATGNIMAYALGKDAYLLRA
jgi:uncharacterized membrane protein YedE/YeeE